MRYKYRRIFFPSTGILFLLCLYWCFSAFSRVEAAEVVPVGSDVMEYIPQSSGQIVHHSRYVLSFNDEHKQANWVYYSLDFKTRKSTVERSDNFREDKYVRTGSAKPSDYTRSGYDRGHLCPAADMADSPEAMSETFYMSNMSPQVPAFNRGIWKILEGKVRSWSREERIHVVTGPVFRNDQGQIGQSRVTVPGYYYKVVYTPVKQQMIAFVLPNGKGDKLLAEYVLTVDSVEHLTGIDFFPQLADSVENRLESFSEYGKWQ